MAAADESFEALIDYIRANRGFDFSGYKRPSLQRRIQKRMELTGVDSYDAYRAYLEEHGDEFRALFNTILINVTTFFRDVPAWEYLREEVVPRIADEARERDGIRIWSTGCASGEEAYTLAIVFAEAFGQDEYRERVKIYATDVDEDALSEGRHGSYPARRLENVPVELRERWFDEGDQRYTVKPELRRNVVFGRHDVVQDPPISRIDLLVSRNTLMYFTKEAQERILANFHFSLRQGAYLFLGKSEMMLSRNGLFHPVELTRRVFRKVESGQILRIPPRAAAPTPPRLAPDRLMHEIGFESAPVAQLVVDRSGTLTLANTQARILLKLAPSDLGRAFKDLEVSYTPVELRSQIDRAYDEHQAISIRDVRLVSPTGDARVMDVQIMPLVSTQGAVVGVGVSFVDVTRYKRLEEAYEASKSEVDTAYEELQSTVEEMETTNEELQSTNEELETTNEELHSTNEELQTMNEELTSTNEELETINDELNQRTDELHQTNVFLESILRSLDAAVIVVDREMRVTAWNDGAYELWGLRTDEVQGEHFLNLDIGLPVEELRGSVRELLAGTDDGDPIEVVGTDRRGRSITCRVRLSPLSANGGAADGAILFIEPAAR